jgi:hypothetical protein
LQRDAWKVVTVAWNVPPDVRKRVFDAPNPAVSVCVGKTLVLIVKQVAQRIRQAVNNMIFAA